MQPPPECWGPRGQGPDHPAPSASAPPWGAPFLRVGWKRFGESWEQLQEKLISLLFSIIALSQPDMIEMEKANTSIWVGVFSSPLVCLLSSVVINALWLVTVLRPRAPGVLAGLGGSERDGGFPPLLPPPGSWVHTCLRRTALSQGGVHAQRRSTCRRLRAAPPPSPSRTLTPVRRGWPWGGQEGWLLTGRNRETKSPGLRAPPAPVPAGAKLTFPRSSDK